MNFGLGYKTKTYNFPICYPLLKFIWTQNLLIIKWAKATSHAALVWVNILLADVYHLCSNMLLSGDDSYHLTWLIYEDAISFAPDVWDRASMIVHCIKGWDYLMEFGLQIGHSGSNPKNLGWVKVRPFKWGLCSSIRKGKINQDWSYQFCFLSFLFFFLVNFVSSHSFACKMERTVILVILAFFFSPKDLMERFKNTETMIIKKKKL